MKKKKGLHFFTVNTSLAVAKTPKNFVVKSDAFLLLHPKVRHQLIEHYSSKRGQLLLVSNTYSRDANEYSSGESIQTFSKAYGGRGFKISPDVIVFQRGIMAEYEIE